MKFDLNDIAGLSLDEKVDKINQIKIALHKISSTYRIVFTASPLS